MSDVAALIVHLGDDRVKCFVQQSTWYQVDAQYVLITFPSFSEEKWEKETLWGPEAFHFIHSFPSNVYSI